MEAKPWPRSAAAGSAAEFHNMDDAKPRKRGNPNWIAGKSGNPGGRPKALRDVEELARQHTPSAIQALAEALGDPDKRVAAAVALLDRAWGKPKVITETTVKRDVLDYSLNELVAIATGRGESGSEDHSGPSKSDPVH